MLEREMTSKERITRLEILALNQTLIIKHLTQAIGPMMHPAIRAQVLEASTEDLLSLIYTDGLPLAVLDLAIEWRQQIASPDIMLTS